MRPRTLNPAHRNAPWTSYCPKKEKPVDNTISKIVAAGIIFVLFIAFTEPCSERDLPWFRERIVCLFDYTKQTAALSFVGWAVLFVIYKINCRKKTNTSPV